MFLATNYVLLQILDERLIFYNFSPKWKIFVGNNMENNFHLANVDYWAGETAVGLHKLKIIFNS
jgi:hypothetical protein